MAPSKNKSVVGGVRSYGNEGKHAPKSPVEDSDLAIEVPYSLKSCDDSGNIDSILDHLSEKEAVIAVDNEVLESLSTSLENVEIGVRKLVLCNTEDMLINDEDGSLFSEFISALHGVSSLRTLVFVGHTFKSVVLPSAFPESISTLVFDSCTIEELDFEEGAANDLQTLVLEKITGLSELVFPEHGCRNLERLKVNRLSSLKSLVIEDEAFEGGEVLEVSNCKNLEGVSVGENCFKAGKGLLMSRNISLIKLTLGENCFYEASTMAITLPELRTFELQGSNFTTLDEVDLTPMSNLVEFKAGDASFQKSTVLICEGLTKLKVLSLGSNCFENGRKIYFIDTVNMRTLEFGSRCFRSILDEDFTVGELTKLETLVFGDHCLTKLDRFVLLKNQCLKTVRFGKGCLKNCEYFVLLNYVNRVHTEEDSEHVMFLPEEYPGLPQEADINCKRYSVCIEACPRLTSIEFGGDCLRSIRHVDMCYLKRLKNISFVSNLFEDAESLSITDNAKLTELVIPAGCFPHMKYFALQDIPELVTLDIDSDVMTDGGFCVMRNLYPTTISVSPKSILCTASSYKSIPKKLQRICVKNLSKFQQIGRASCRERV